MRRLLCAARTVPEYSDSWVACCGSYRDCSFILPSVQGADAAVRGPTRLSNQPFASAEPIEGPLRLGNVSLDW